MESQELYEKRMHIKTQRMSARGAVDSFRWSRSKEVSDELRFKTEQERYLITQFEQEARELERMEAELIMRLHATQASERQAFQELEHAMITASLPKKERLMIIQEMAQGQEDPHAMENEYIKSGNSREMKQS